MRAADLMSGSPLTVPTEMPVLAVQHLLVQANVGGVPVVDAQGQVRGLITRTDLLRVMDHLNDEDEDEVDAPEMLTALDIATPSPTWVLPDTPVAEVARLMQREGIHRVLVGTDGKLAGILSAFDLLGAVT